MNVRVATAAAAAFLVTTILVAAGSPGPPAAHAARYAEGAPPGFSGGFGEQSCDACHFHNELNAAPGRVSIDSLPDRFVPGERYPLTVTLSRPDMKLAGFQLTARFEDGGAQAGTVAPAADEQERLRVDVQSGVQYANQHKNGTAATSKDVATWSLVWTAPPSSGPVVFHVAANAADGDGTVEGDYVYTASAALAGK